MNYLLTAVGCLFMSLQVAAQTQHYEVKSEALEHTADSLTQVYSMKLGMTPKQDLLFKESLEDYLVFREEAEAKLSGKAKLDELTRVYMEESEKMSEILTEYQFELYEKIKPGIQPIDRIQKD